MKGKLKRAAALLIVCVLVFGLGVGAWAESEESLDLSKACTIRVIFDPDGDKQPPPDNMVVDIYRIAEANPADSGSNESFILVPIEPYGTIFNSEANDWELLAQELAELTINGNIEKINSGDDIKPDVDIPVGTAGLFLIIVHDADVEPYGDNGYVRWIKNDKGEDTLVTTVTNKEGDGVHLFAPLLVTVPEYNSADEYGKAVWLYDVSRSLKSKTDEPETPTINVRKVDSNNPNLSLPGAKFELYSAQPVNDNGKTINVYVEGVGEVTLYFQPSEDIEYGYYTTDDNGNIQIKGFDMPPYTLFALKEIEAPDGYVLSEDPYYYFLTGGDENLSVSIIGLNKSNEAVDEGLIVTGGYGSADVIVKHISGDKPFYVRVKIFSDGECNFAYAGWSESNDGYWYYDELLSDNMETGMLNVNAEYSEETSYTPNVLVICEITYHTMLEDDEPKADWSKAIPLTVADAYSGSATVLTGDYSITIGNSPKEILVDLPGIGGMGTTVFYIAGAMMIGSAIGLMTIKKRKQNIEG